MAKSPNRRSRGLGRGLDALLGDALSGSERAEAEAEAGASSAPMERTESAREVTRLPIGMLHPGSLQPRQHMQVEALEELAASMREHGVLQPILVRPHPLKSGEYEIVAGERRWRAAAQAQIHDVPVLVRELADSEALEVAIVENLQRRDLSPIEEARGFRRLMDEFDHTQDSLAQVLGKSRSHLANTLRLLRLPERVKQLVDEGVLTAGHARALIGHGDAGVLALRIVRDGLSVRQTEDLVRDTEDTDNPAAKGKAAVDGKSSDTLALEAELSAHLGLMVRINGNGAAGTLQMRYQTLEQLDYVINLLQSK